MQRCVEIGGRQVGPGHPVYVVAEMSANHHQDFDEAVRVVRAAKEAGADAVKLQTYTPDTITMDADGECFRIGRGTIWGNRTLYDLYREAYTPWEWQPKLKALADEIGLDLFSTPFDESAVEFLEGMSVVALKVASFEIVDLPLVRRVARSGRPVIMSTGMASLMEIAEAVHTFREAGGSQAALLKCTSAYPASPEDINLRTIPHLAEAFDLPVGLSDHTLGIAVPVAAVALGACIIEKHLILSRTGGGPDAAFSLEPSEFAEMVKAVRTAERALGRVSYSAGPAEEVSRTLRRSLFVVKDVRAGEVFTGENVRSIRPGHGLHTRYIEQVIGRQASRDVPRGTPLTWDLLSGQSSGEGVGGR